MQWQKERQEKHPNTVGGSTATYDTIALPSHREISLLACVPHCQSAKKVGIKTEKERETKWSFVSIDVGMVLFAFRDGNSRVIFPFRQENQGQELFDGNS